jgi:hypothetical protein
MIKYSNVMRISELCRADRITGRTDGRRNLKAERSAMRRLLAERAKQGKVEKVGRSGWRAIYFAFAAALLLLSVVADPAAAQHSTTFRNSQGQTTGPPGDVLAGALDTGRLTRQVKRPIFDR